MNSLILLIYVPVRFNAYIAAVYQMPMLGKEEEKQLAEDLFEKGDLESAQRLVLAHLRVVVSVSRQYLSYSLSSRYYSRRKCRLDESC